MWLAENPQQAMTHAKSGRDVPERSCDNPIARQYELALRVGLQGTPLIITEQGSQMPGYVPPADLREALDQMAGAAAQ